MKIINNQDTRLIDEIKSVINETSNVCISCNHFTVFALFEIIDVLSKSNTVKVLLDFNFSNSDEFKFIQESLENILNLSLDRKYKTDQVIG